jgi:hypothetical protein
MFLFQVVELEFNFTQFKLQIRYSVENDIGDHGIRLLS